MKCKNCYGNYSSRELCCPYCGTDNPRGRLWKRRRDQADFDLKTAEEASKPIMRRYMANRALNRILLVEGALVLLFIISVVAVFFFSEKGLALSSRINQGSIISDLETMYAEERFSEMYYYLQEKDLFSNDTYYEYCQMALLHTDYTKFCTSRLRFFRESESGTLSEYTPERLVMDMHSVFNGYIPAYRDLTDRNRAIWERYCRDTEVFATAVLGFTEDEMALLRQDYLLMEEETVLTDAIWEGRCWDVQ